MLMKGQQSGLRLRNHCLVDCAYHTVVSSIVLPVVRAFPVAADHGSREWAVRRGVVVLRDGGSAQYPGGSVQHQPCGHLAHQAVPGLTIRVPGVSVEGLVCKASNRKGIQRMAWIIAMHV